MSRGGGCSSSGRRGIASEEGGGTRWSVDHLFLDQDGVPTLVEVKRSTDTRIRREVVGQLLEYAANATAYWASEELQLSFEATCETRGIAPRGRGRCSRRRRA